MGHRCWTQGGQVKAGVRMGLRGEVLTIVGGSGESVFQEESVPDSCTHCWDCGAVLLNDTLAEFLVSMGYHPSTWPVPSGRRGAEASKG